MIIFNSLLNNYLIPQFVQELGFYVFIYMFLLHLQQAECVMERHVGRKAREERRRSEVPAS